MTQCVQNAGQYRHRTDQTVSGGGQWVCVLFDRRSQLHKRVSLIQASEQRPLNAAKHSQWLSEPFCHISLSTVRWPAGRADYTSDQQAAYSQAAVLSLHSVTQVVKRRLCPWSVEPIQFN